MNNEQNSTTLSATISATVQAMTAAGCDSKAIADAVSGIVAQLASLQLQAMPGFKAKSGQAKAKPRQHVYDYLLGLSNVSLGASLLDAWKDLARDAKLTKWHVVMLWGDKPHNGMMQRDYWTVARFMAMNPEEIGQRAKQDLADNGSASCVWAVLKGYGPSHSGSFIAGEKLA